jgi:hypothetical protein
MKATIRKEIEVYGKKVFIAADFLYSDEGGNAHTCTRCACVPSESEGSANFQSWDGGVYVEKASLAELSAELVADVEKYVEKLQPWRVFTPDEINDVIGA